MREMRARGTTTNNMAVVVPQLKTNVVTVNLTEECCSTHTHIYIHNTVLSCLINCNKMLMLHKEWIQVFNFLVNYINDNPSLISC